MIRYDVIFARSLQVALQHLVHVETLAKSIRKQTAAKEKALAEASSERVASGKAPPPGERPC